MRPSTRPIVRSTIEWIGDHLELSNSRAVSAVARRTGGAYQAALLHPPPSWARHAIELAQLRDPLRDVRELPPIDLVIPCHVKDVATLALALAGGRASSRNPLNAVWLITPPESVDRLQSEFPEVEVESEAEVLGEMLVDTVDGYVPIERRGWVIQQLIKLTASMTSAASATLVIDADTVLLAERTWLTAGGVQLLSYSRDFHLSYEAHATQVWGRDAAPTGMNYITHHQLMQRDVMEEMFPEGRTSLARWVRLADWSNSSSALADYYSYGVWTSRNKRNRVRFGQLLNVGVSRTLLPNPEVDVRAQLAELRFAFPAALSVSFHTYLDSPGSTIAAPRAT